VRHRTTRSLMSVPTGAPSANRGMSTCAAKNPFRTASRNGDMAQYSGCTAKTTAQFRSANIRAVSRKNPRRRASFGSWLSLSHRSESSRTRTGTRSSSSWISATSRSRLSMKSPRFRSISGDVTVSSTSVLNPGSSHPSARRSESWSRCRNDLTGRVRADAASASSCRAPSSSRASRAHLTTSRMR
jgi:hypothetical protein